MPVPAVLYRISTAEIIKRAVFPGNPAEALPGMDPDYKWLITYIPFEAPDFDIRLFSMVTKETITSTPHPDYPIYSQFLVTYETVKKPDEVIAAQVDNAERAALSRVFPAADQLKTLTLGLGVLAKISEKLELDPDEKKVMADVIALADKVWINSDNAAAKKAEALAGGQPNLDADWAAPAAVAAAEPIVP